jgi:hypothetical protein
MNTCYKILIKTYYKCTEKHLTVYGKKPVSLYSYTIIKPVKKQICMTRFFISLNILFLLHIYKINAEYQCPLNILNKRMIQKQNTTVQT